MCPINIRGGELGKWAGAFEPLQMPKAPQVTQIKLKQFTFTCRKEKTGWVGEGEFPPRAFSTKA